MKFSQRPLLIAAALLAITVSADSSSAAGSASTAALPNLSSAVSEQSAAKASQTASTSSPTDTGSSSSGHTTAVITGSGQTAGTAAVPTITGSAASSGGGALTNLPTLAGGFVIVAPSVPPTANAPFMQYSRMPDGTVFIVVGAILGFLAMCVVCWRALVAWALHRSVKRATQEHNLSHEKALFRAPAVPFYKQYKDRESSLSLANLKASNRKSSRPPTANLPVAVSQASLFYSPTAGAAGPGLNQGGNRGSNYLPAGYYAAGAAQPGNGQGVAHIGHHPTGSVTNFGPSARDSYSGSPVFTPHHGVGASTSSLNLIQPPGEQRAPSAYLDDLFDREDGPP